nr:hypothetical protein [Tanacetum cinerariifolium]
MGNEELNTILEKESDEFIKSSVEDLVPIPSESEDTFGSDIECILPSCDDFSPINVSEEKFVTLSNPLFNSNDYFTSSDDESLSDEDVPDDNFKIYSNPLFEFDDEYISRNDIELLLYRDPFTHMMSVVSILEGFTDEPPLEENDDLFDLESKENEWKKILYDAPIDDRHYLFFTYVVRILLLYLTYSVVSPFLVSSESKDTIFDPDIFAFYFSHQSGTFMCFNVYLNVLNESPMEIFSFTHFNPYIMMIKEALLFLSRVLCFVIYVQDCPDFEDSRAHGFVHRLLELQIRYI